MIRTLRLLAAATVVAWCTACAPLVTRTGALPAPALVLHDELFPGATAPVDPSRVFELDAPMRDFVQTHLARPGHGLSPLGALAEAVGRRDMLHLVYDSSRTRSAQEAFADRAGNCMSLVLMTAALAHALDLRVEFHEARTDPYWSRNGELLLASGHINVSVLPPLRDLDNGREIQEYMFDFLEAQDAFALPRRDIGESTVVAMFLNNRAAESLQAHRLPEAYAYARLAVMQDPGLALAYNTLGVIYLGAGAAPAAVQAFRTALLLAPDNARTLGNLADTLRQTGDIAEADRLTERLARLEPEPPFHLFDLGVAAYERHDYASAQALFRREAARTDYSAELHFWMARTAWALGEPTRARREIEAALDRSTTTGERSRYAAKLEWLREQAHVQN